MCAVQGSEDKPVSDQYLEAFVIVDSAGAPVGTVQDSDAGDHCGMLWAGQSAG